MVSALLLLLVDLPDYWVVFLLVFLMAAFPVQGETLDSISEPLAVQEGRSSW